MLQFLALLTTIFVVRAQQQNTTNDPFQKLTISTPDGSINASYIGYGARLTNLFVPDRNGTSRDIVLGYDQGSQYLNDTQGPHTYFGATVGRYAGRMKNATFTLDGQKYDISANENGGLDSLHGGKVGYDQRNWTLVSSNETSLTFMLLDDGFEGYPGRVVTYATFSVAGGGDDGEGEGPGTAYSLTTRLVSIPLDSATPLMVITHPYFNLDGFSDPSDQTILKHTLHMPYSSRYVEIDNIEVATGAIGSVLSSSNSSNGTSPQLLDFTSLPAKSFDFSITDGNVQQCGLNCTGIDTNFIIDRPPNSGDSASDIPVLTLASNTTGIKFDLYANQQALIVYTCNKLNGTIPLKQGQQDAARGTGGSNETFYAQMHGCVAIETQGWIDGINHPEFGQMAYQVFSPGSEPSVSWTKYEFSVI